MLTRSARPRVEIFDEDERDGGAHQSMGVDDSVEHDREEASESETRRREERKERLRVRRTRRQDDVREEANDDEEAEMQVWRQKTTDDECRREPIEHTQQDEDGVRRNDKKVCAQK